MVVVLPFMLKKLGHRWCVIAASLCICAALCVRLVDPQNLSIIYASLALMGLGQGFTYAGLFAMIPDTAEYDEYLDHERHEDLIYAGASFGTKVAAALGTVIPSFVMNIGGCVNDAAVQSDSAMSAILMSAP